MQLGQKALMELQQGVETNLSLAKHAEGWAWRRNHLGTPRKPI
jgi:hypothetical protein